MTKSWWHGRAILAQGCPATSIMSLFFWRFALLLCAVSHVPSTVSCDADDFNSRSTRSLWAAGQPVEQLHCSCRGPEGRHAAAGRIAGKCCQRSPGTSSTRRWYPSFCGSGLPCGTHLQPGKRMQDTRGGGNWDSWSALSPFGGQHTDIQTVDEPNRLG